MSAEHYKRPWMRYGAAVVLGFTAVNLAGASYNIAREDRQSSSATLPTHTELVPAPATEVATDATGGDTAPLAGLLAGAVIVAAAGWRKRSDEQPITTQSALDGSHESMLPDPYIVHHFDQISAPLHLRFSPETGSFDKRS